MTITQENGLEIILDKIADKLIENIDVFSGETDNISFLKQNQKTIRNGLIAKTRSTNEKLVLFQKDATANLEDLITHDPDLMSQDGNVFTLGTIVEQLIGQEEESITITIDTSGGAGSSGYGNIYINNSSLPFESGQVNITNLIFPGANSGNPLNISQFLSIEQKETVVNIDQANEYLSTNIYELLPKEISRQARIDKFFQEYNLLKGDIPNYVLDENGKRVSYEIS